MIMLSPQIQQKTLCILSTLADNERWTMDLKEFPRPDHSLRTTQNDKKSPKHLEKRGSKNQQHLAHQALVIDTEKFAFTGVGGVLHGLALILEGLVLEGIGSRLTSLVSLNQRQH